MRNDFTNALETPSSMSGPSFFVRLRLTPVAWAGRVLVCGLSCATLVVTAQDVPSGLTDADDPMPVLKPSGQLLEQLPAEVRRDTPTFVTGDRVEGEPNIRTVVQGQAVLRRHDTIVKADRVELDHRSNEAKATGGVMIWRNGNRFDGPELQLNLDSYVGFFTQPQYQLLRNDAQGQADRVDFLNEDVSVAHNSTYSTCPRPDTDEGPPDWWISARKLTLNQAEDVGEAEGGVLYFKGIPLLAAPYVSFPLSDKRKSGLLPPTINLDNISGLEYTQPYYWNIAPHLDATFFPTLMTKRGLDLGAEFRYLQPRYNGQLRGSWMPDDRLLRANRWGLTAQHKHELDPGWLGMSALGLRWNINRVSDDTYWRDFPKVSPALTQRLLPNEWALSGQRGALAWTAGIYQWQTLQDAAAPIVAPYDRVPQIDVHWGGLNQRMAQIDGLDWSLTGQYSRFRTPRAPSVSALLADINGTRTLGIAQISKLWQTPGWFVRPKAQLHMSHYSFEQALWNGQRSASRVLPTLSVDSALVFERATRWFGREVLQTLEPRAMYVYTPYRDQSHLPMYDSAAKDFNFGTVWAENDFGGQDRISDTHALTVGASTRLIDPNTGAEAVRLGLAQRLRFADQRVTLPGGLPITDTVSDILLGAGIQWDPAWQFEGGVQFNPHTGRSQRTTLTARYHPARHRVLSAAYRLQRVGGILPASEQMDVGWQWPLSDLWQPTPDESASTATSTTLADRKATRANQWYSVGRINYSMADRKVVDLVLGVEYEACCWIGRVVLERLQRSNANTGQRILFQLEFNGFSRIGSNPLQTLRDNVPRYQPLRDEVQTPSRFGRYE